MLRFLIIAHAPLASALKAVAAHIDAEAAQSVEAIDVTASLSQDDVIAAASVVLDRMGSTEVLVFTDVFGATPCNAARRIGERAGVRVVAGVNVPALWRAVGHRHEPVDRVAELAVSGGQQGLMHVSVTRPQYQSTKHNPDDSQHDHHQQ
ncbi:MAG: PTS fructose transporter subunit IIA [Ideonella sp.]|nr:PTS fructose transporter subunit IIA [Ideonella sp.]